jgi:alkanesulfonate monooxygenase SsuD/methylene tetrahydromethanopterin reductase-like flavin-dependent oxidoreductase (luciferase family)
MVARMGLGVGFTPFETRTDVIARVARHAEDIGLDRVDVAEGWTHDSMIVLAELAARTSRIALGTSIISVWGRTPATMAVGAAGLQRCSGGRFSLGIGAGSPPLAEGFHGLQWERPLARMRETWVRFARSSPASAFLSLRQARGLCAWGSCPSRRCRSCWRRWLRARSGSRGSSPTVGRRSYGPGRASGREGSFCRKGEARSEASTHTQASLGVPVALGAIEAGARRIAAWWLSTYLTRMGPLYPRMLGERFAMGAAVSAVLEAADGNASPELPAAAEELARDVTLFGTYDEAGDAIGAWFAAGADNLNLVLPPGHPEEELVEFLNQAKAA